MNLEIENLDIIFRRAKPERILEHILERNKKKYSDGDYLNINTSDSEESWVYEHAMRERSDDYTPDEIYMRFRLTGQKCDLNKGMAGGAFEMLADFAKKHLCGLDEDMVCRMNGILDWQNAFLLLGQDIFTTAYIADKDKDNHRICFPSGYSFTWPTILKTNDNKLNVRLEKGISENHFHLNGSTQTFSLSWICMMNHPDKIVNCVGDKGRFRFLLTPTKVFDTESKAKSIAQWIEYASVIRAILYSRLRNNIGEKCVRNLFEEYSFSYSDYYRQNISRLRFESNVRFLQPDKSRKCLDYAIDRRHYMVDGNAMTRMLSGERAFLYHCFRMVYAGYFSNYESNLFYLYIVIKSRVRGELVQLNRMPGFRNFARYQDRKEQLFDGITEYEVEALRLSAGVAFRENNMLSLEMRFAPAESSGALHRKISKYDKRIAFALGEQEKNHGEYDNNYFYVAHFIKNPTWAENFDFKVRMIPPRNIEIRKSARKQAIAIKRYIDTYGDNRLHGIDAANFEIGCRPETFATEFRFLKRIAYDGFGMNRKYIKHWGRTYHAGEDFLDIVDGIRAIDEAVLYLELERGDRIGHALALGTEPKAYYNLKGNSVVMSKQDLLDNLLWLRDRTHDFGVVLSQYAKKEIKLRAHRLFYEIYADSIYESENNLSQSQSIEDYYYDYHSSWILRGDHPDLYSTGRYIQTRYKYISENYGKFLEMNAVDGRDMRMIRQNPRVSKLLHLYHWNSEVRRKGMEIEEFFVELWFEELVEAAQHALQKMIARKGIAIECNPTSNVLIGAFGEYELHPLLKFDKSFVGDDDRNPNLNISINTDDIGVFDTSLSNEYAMMFAAIRKKRHEEGNENDLPIYEYLDHIRENGNAMSFCRKRVDI